MGGNSRQPWQYRSRRRKSSCRVSRPPGGAEGALGAGHLLPVLTGEPAGGVGLPGAGSGCLRPPPPGEGVDVEVGVGAAVFLEEQGQLLRPGEDARLLPELPKDRLREVSPPAPSRRCSPTSRGTGPSPFARRVRSTSPLLFTMTTITAIWYSPGPGAGPAGGCGGVSCGLCRRGPRVLPWRFLSWGVRGKKEGPLRPGSTGGGGRPPPPAGAGRRGAPGGAGPFASPFALPIIKPQKGGERKGLGVEQLRGLLGGQLDVSPGAAR